MDEQSMKTDLSYEEAMESPCTECSSSPCCVKLPIHNFRVQTVDELDHALYILNYSGMEITLTDEGEWNAYYSSPCRHLNPKTGLCAVHNTPAQPAICVHYNPFGCWYKRTFSLGEMEHQVRLDARRLRAIAERVTFEESGRIRTFPPWPEILAMVGSIEADFQNAFPLPKGLQDQKQEEEEDQGKSNRFETLQTEEGVYDWKEMRRNCGTCGSHCCRTLLFPRPRPTAVSDLDTLLFMLGFEGVDLEVGPDGWFLALQSQCRYLEGNRCSIYDDPHRPFACRFYNSLTCAYRPRFEDPYRGGSIRFDYESFSGYYDSFRFDKYGRIALFPDPPPFHPYME